MGLRPLGLRCSLIDQTDEPFERVRLVSEPSLDRRGGLKGFVYPDKIAVGDQKVYSIHVVLERLGKARSLAREASGVMPDGQFEPLDIRGSFYLSCACRALAVRDRIPSRT